MLHNNLNHWNFTIASKNQYLLPLAFFNMTRQPSKFDHGYIPVFDRDENLPNNKYPGFTKEAESLRQEILVAFPALPCPPIEKITTGGYSPEIQDSAAIAEDLADQCWTEISPMIIYLNQMNLTLLAPMAHLRAIAAFLSYPIAEEAIPQSASVAQWLVIHFCNKAIQSKQLVAAEQFNMFSDVQRKIIGKWLKFIVKYKDWYEVKSEDIEPWLEYWE